MTIRFPLVIKESETKGLQRLGETDELDIMTFPLKHRIPCQGYLFREKTSKQHFNKQALTELHLTPEQIKAALRGEEIFIRDERVPREIIFLPPVPPMSYAYCSDTAFFPQMASWLNNISVLYHEATFRQELEALAMETGHSTSGDAARIAVEANASCLLLGHFSSRYKDLEGLEQEARAIFPNTILSEEGKTYKLRELAFPS